MASKVGKDNSGLTLNPAQVNEISLLFNGTLFKDGQELVDKLKRSQQVRMNEGVEVTLNTDDLWQLKQQAIGMSRVYEDYVKDFILDSISLQLNGSYATKGY